MSILCGRCLRPAIEFSWKEGGSAWNIVPLHIYHRALPIEVKLWLFKVWNWANLRTSLLQSAKRQPSQRYHKDSDELCLLVWKRLPGRFSLKHVLLIAWMTWCRPFFTASSKASGGRYVRLGKLLLRQLLVLSLLQQLREGRAARKTLRLSHLGNLVPYISYREHALLFIEGPYRYVRNHTKPAPFYQARLKSMSVPCCYGYTFGTAQVGPSNMRCSTPSWPQQYNRPGRFFILLPFNSLRSCILSTETHVVRKRNGITRRHAEKQSRVRAYRPILPGDKHSFIVLQTTFSREKSARTD